MNRVLSVYVSFLALSNCPAVYAQFGPQQVITSDAQSAESVFAADLDGDGDLDVLSASEIDDTVAWYENTNGLGAFGPKRIITDQADDAESVFAADLDGDGDLDVLSASEFDDAIAWYENTDGLGHFGPRRFITTTADAAEAVHAADLDGDGDLDVLSASEADDTVAWFENTDGKGGFGPKRVISDRLDGPEAVVAADLDGDGDLDVLSAVEIGDRVVWHENTDGVGTFGPTRVITMDTDDAESVFAADLDGDGDLDVLSASSADDIVAWYENTDGLGAFGAQRIISSTSSHPEAVFAADLDRDGDLDVLAASAFDDTISWYENTDGSGTFGPQLIISTEAVRAESVFAADLDGDGDLDVLSASNDDNKIAWYENLIPLTNTRPDDLRSSGYVVSAAYPDPFDHTAAFTVEVARLQQVVVSIYDAQGRLRLDLQDRMLEPGRVHRFVIEADELPPGVYVVRVVGEHFSASRSVVRVE